MSKHDSTNARRKNDKYYTLDWRAVAFLHQFIDRGTRFIEPCAGAGDLIKSLELHGHKCVFACDIEPEGRGIAKADALQACAGFPSADAIITNPPWEREILHKMIECFRQNLPTWLLFDADWKETDQAAPYLKYCSDIVPCGRLVFIEDTDNGGKTNNAWYRFQAEECETIFHAKKKISH